MADSEGDTFRTGLSTGGEYAGPGGIQISTVSQIAESGYLWGTSHRYNGFEDEVGTRPWVAHASTGITTPIGLIGEEYTRNSDGMTNSGVGNGISSVPMTSTGYLIGHSRRYNPFDNAINGQAAWVASAVDRTTHRVGLHVGPEFVRSVDGFQSSTVLAITESGFVRGRSTRFDFGTTIAGPAAWVASKSGGATRIGFHGTPEFTRSNGNYEESTSAAINEAGQVIGHSLRYDGVESRGQAAWRATFSSTGRLGLYGEATIYRSSTLGTEYTLVQKLTEGGTTSGYSFIYDQESGEHMGQAAWIAEVGGGSIRLGDLSTRNDGYESSSIAKPTKSGHVHGSTNRYGGNVLLGNIAWTASASTGFATRVVGLEGPVSRAATTASRTSARPRGSTTSRPGSMSPSSSPCARATTTHSPPSPSSATPASRSAATSSSTARTT